MSDRKYDPTDPLDVAQRLAYNKALADAKAAVILLASDDDPSPRDLISIGTALAAIEKLKEK